MRKIRKGQVRIILELFLFAMGIMIALFASSFFNQFSVWISKTVEKDQLDVASNLISNGFVKLHVLDADASINLDLIPYTNENSYIIEAFGNQITLYNIYNYSLRSSSGLFYISEDKNINGSASSSTGKIIVKASRNSIEILR